MMIWTDKHMSDSCDVWMSPLMLRSWKPSVRTNMKDVGHSVGQLFKFASGGF